MNELEKFIIHYLQNSTQIMWFLGAGASRSSGIPTAWDIIWELKCRIYCLAQGKTFSNYSDYTSPAIRDEVQSFLNGQEEFKNISPHEEYSFFLEYVYKDDPSGLREFFQQKIKNDTVHPSYGHKFLGILLKEKICNIIWTTNFDSVIEDAFSEIGGKPSDLNVAELSGSVLAKQAINEGSKSFPLYVKLHGDFRFQNIKNLEKDLQQNIEFSEALEIACNQYGMAISGYSGRDKSVMRYIDNALEGSNPFPQGLYWFTRSRENTLPVVQDLISKAKTKSVKAELIEIDSFNELMSSIKKQFSGLPKELLREHLDKKFLPSKIALPEPGRNYPIIKVNALPIIHMPQKCYVLRNPDINDYKSLREEMKEANQYFPVAYRNGEILSFDNSIKEIIKGDLDVFTITEAMLKDRNETHLNNLLQRKFFNVIAEKKPVRIYYRAGTCNIVVDHENKDDPLFQSLSRATQKANKRNRLNGNIRNTKMFWAESVKLRLERKLSRFWLLFRPDIWIYEGDKEREGYLEEWGEAKSFKDDQLKWRRNYENAMLINSWQEILFGKVSRTTPVDIVISDGDLVSERVSLINSLGSSGRN